MAKRRMFDFFQIRQMGNLLQALDCLVCWFCLWSGGGKQCQGIEVFERSIIFLHDLQIFKCREVLVSETEIGAGAVLNRVMRPLHLQDGSQEPSKNQECGDESGKTDAASLILDQ